MAGKLLALLCAAVASGCAFVTGTIYVPANAGDTVRGRGCGVPYAYFERQIAEGVKLRVDFHWWDHRPPMLEVRGSLEDGKSIKFLDNRIRISSASDISVIEFEGLLVAGSWTPGMLAPTFTFAPTEQLAGVHFIALPIQLSISGITNRAEPIVISLPRIIANGTDADVAQIMFKPEQYSTIAFLCT
jgi:hypothetical protein